MPAVQHAVQGVQFLHGPDAGCTEHDETFLIISATISTSLFGWGCCHDDGSEWNEEYDLRGERMVGEGRLIFKAPAIHGCVCTDANNHTRTHSAAERDVVVVRCCLRGYE